ncbi:hypothetical protein ACFQWF_03820 [Methylorubrum suomiense]
MPHSASRSLKPVLHTRLVAALGLGLTLTTAWAGAASYYLIFHDEMLARFVSRQSAMQYTYEERVDTLQRALDRATSDHTATRSAIETRLSTLAERQAVIERRQGILTGLPGAAAESDVTTTGSIPSVEPPPMPTRPQKPFPTPELRMHSGEWSGVAPLTELRTSTRRSWPVWRGWSGAWTTWPSANPGPWPASPREPETAPTASAT